MNSLNLIRVIIGIFLFCFLIADLPLDALNNSGNDISKAGISCIFDRDKNKVGASELSLLYLLGTGAGVAALYYVFHKKRSKK